MKIEFVKTSFIAFDTLVKDGQLKASPELSKVHETVRETLRLISSQADSATIKLDKGETLSAVEELVWKDKSFWQNPEAKIFLLALNELGVSSDQILIDTVLHLLEKKENSAEALREFIAIFPECKTAQDSKGRNLASVAIEKASLSSIIELAKAGFDFITSDHNGNTALHYLAMSNHFRSETYSKNLIDIFPTLRKVENLNFQNIDGRTPLHLCAMNRHKNLFSFFCDIDQNYLFTDKTQKTALHLYFMNENSLIVPDLIKKLVAKHGINPNSIDINGNTALHLAAIKGDVEGIKELLSVGANPDIQNKNGETALHILAKIDGSGSAIEILQPQDSTRDLKNIQNLTALEVAIENKQWANLVYFLKKMPDVFSFTYNGMSLVDIAVKNESSILLDYLIDVDENLLIQADDKSLTLLHRVILEGSASLTKCCLDNGAFIDVKDENGQGVADFAVESRNPEVLRILFENKLEDLLLSDSVQAERAFNRALELKDMEMVGVFIENSFITDNPSVGGKPLAAYAYETKNWLIIEALCAVMLDYDIPINFFRCFDGKMNEVVIKLAEENCFQVLNYMIHLDLVRFENTDVSKSFVTEAVRHGEWGMLEESIEKCVDCEQIEIDGVPLVFIAANEGSDGIVSYFLEKEIVNPLSEHGGQKLIDIIINHKMIEPLILIVNAVDQLKNLKVDLSALLRLAVDGFENARTNNSQLDSEKIRTENFEILIEMLISKGINFSSVQINGLPFLHYACKNLSIICVESLLEAKASVFQRDSLGRTALFYALQKNNFEIFETLVKYGAKIYIDEWNFEIPKFNLANYFNSFSQDLMGSSIDARLLFFLYGFRLKNLNTEFVPELEAEFVPKSGAGVIFIRKKMHELLRFYQEQNLESVKEVPDIDYPGDSFAEIQFLRDLFKAIPDENLEGVLGIDEVVVDVNVQRKNFEKFLSIVEHAEHITGVNAINPSETYTPIQRSLRHLALKIPLLDDSERITMLTQFSRINEGFCIDPYLKASKWVYGALVSQKEGDESGASFEMGDPEVNLRRKLYEKMRDCRDYVLQATAKGVDGSINTHALNWVYKHFGPEIGTSFDGEDMHLEGHGMQMLATSLGLPDNKESLLKELEARFDNLFTSYAFTTMSRFLMQEIEFQGAIESEQKPRREVIIDYFHSLIDLHKNEQMEKTLKLSAQESEGRTYIGMKASVEPFQKTFNKERANLSRLNRQLDLRKSLPINEDPQIALKRSELIKNLETKIAKQKILFTEAEEALSTEQSKVSNFVSANKDICKIVDTVEDQARDEHAAVAGQYVSYSEESLKVKISTQGCWQFFKLFTLYERTAV